MRGSLLGMTMLGALLCGPTHASDSPLEVQITDCAAISDTDERLACFDAVAARLRGQPAAQDAASQTDETTFGEEFLRREEPDEPRQGPTSVTSTVERIEQRPRGEYVFHLANGQVWTELEVGRARYQAGIAVTIERTTFGSYMLSTERGRATRVRRLE